MELVAAPKGQPQTVALLPGSFNPPTRAHLELAAAALHFVDAVLFVLPRQFPHKPWSGASFEQRLIMLRRIADRDPRLGVAVAEGGLYIEMAREAEALFPGASIELVLGRDAAERIATWEYGEKGVFEQLTRSFTLRVAPRCGVFAGGEQLPVPAECESVSATEVRRRIAEGLDWQELVPGEIGDLVREFYGAP